VWRQTRHPRHDRDLCGFNYRFNAFYRSDNHPLSNRWEGASKR